ncbi:ParA family protein [Planktothrix agardhii]|jgi:nitrogenase subunit NifH|uniref:ParA family protein n=1 Tax=Planktothrix agardhii TaxID=1160 RepID=UPI001A1D0C85|nr:hypothetical protein [Planktothrix agardhii KL2]MCB8762876.1 hypothetical protein [Planktothrix agardhii 1809]MCB8776472.1 hypothetical protein [Planktothrix agardhii 1031]MCB8780898.1 hypothetical protein [Planktothrix agardhii 1808]MCB8785221.1 hypothetical protein [Planktothrix agardhii 1025]
MKVICVNHKGGVGKTTTAIHITGVFLETGNRIGCPRKLEIPFSSHLMNIYGITWVANIFGIITIEL